jgi:voltage-gated sodium channel
MIQKLRDYIETNRFQYFIIAVIIANAITLGLETAPVLVGRTGMQVLQILDLLFLAIFTIELLAKLLVYRLTFFRSGWNVFDFMIVAISYLPFIESLSVLRALRILRVLRLVSMVPQFRKVTQAFFDSLSGLATIGTILLLIFYVGAVMATKLFGEDFPDWFGTIGRSLYSLFQIMTLESWSMGIVRPVMEVFPYAWIFFVPFILITTFATLNLVIGVIVNSMQTLSDTTVNKIDEHLHIQDADRAALKAKLDALQSVIDEVRKKL